MRPDFKGKVVLVAGAATGIGAAVALGFAQAGARVVVSDIAPTTDTLAAIAAAGGSAADLPFDVTDAQAVETALAEVMAQHGALHHVVVCAGIATRHTIGQMPVETWRRVIDVNLTGGFLLIKAAEPHLTASGGGSVTLISSVAARHVAYFSGAHYAASKTAQLGLVRHAAFELGRLGIRVNAIGPGPMRNRMGGEAHSDAQLKASSRNLPLQQVVDPEDIADACLFLASPMARSITGVYLPVDGGFLTSRGQPYRTYFDLHEAPF